MYAREATEYHSERRRFTPGLRFLHWRTSALKDFCHNRHLFFCSSSGLPGQRGLPFGRLPVLQSCGDRCKATASQIPREGCLLSQVLRHSPDLLIVVSGSLRAASLRHAAKSFADGVSVRGIHFGMRLSEVPTRPIHDEEQHSAALILSGPGVISFAALQVPALWNRTVPAQRQGVPLPCLSKLTRRCTPRISTMAGPST